MTASEPNTQAAVGVAAVVAKPVIVMQNDDGSAPADPAAIEVGHDQVLKKQALASKDVEENVPLMVQSFPLPSALQLPSCPAIPRTRSSCFL
jgi:hypothetical protein